MSFSLSFSSSNLKVSSKRVQKVKMVLNSSVKRNVSTKNIEEVGDREGGGKDICMAAGQVQKGEGGWGGGGEGEKCDSPLTFSLPPNPLALSTADTQVKRA